jgi:hypothetical protein
VREPVGRPPEIRHSHWCRLRDDPSVWGDSPRSDLEDVHDGREPDEDGEPSLGSLDQERAWFDGDLNIYDYAALPITTVDRSRSAAKVGNPACPADTLPEARRFTLAGRCMGFRRRFFVMRPSD